MKRFIQVVCIVLFFSSFMYSCSNKKGDSLQPSIVITDTVRYSKDIVPIFNTYCALPGCHAGGYTSPDLTTYNDIPAYKDQIYNRVIVIGDMPQSGSTPLPPLEKAKLKKWLDEGAPNN